MDAPHANMTAIDYNQSRFYRQAARRGRRWRYQIDWYREPATRSNVVVLTSKPRDISAEGLVSVAAWTNKEDEMGAGDVGEQPVIVYVQVNIVDLCNLLIVVLLQVNKCFISGPFF